MSDFPIPQQLRPEAFWRRADEESRLVSIRNSPELNQFVADNIDKRDFNKRLAAKLRDNAELTHLYWETGYTSQFMLECISTMRNLEVLSIGYSRAKDLSAIADLQRLQCLSIVSVGPATDLGPLCQLENLVSAFVGVSVRATNIDAFSSNSLSKLRALQLGESSENVVTLDSLDPLRSIESLEYLALGRIRARDRSLAGVLALPLLKKFQYDKNAGFAPAEIDILKSRGIDAATF